MSIPPIYLKIDNVTSDMIDYDTIADELLHQYEISGEFSDLRDFLREAIAEYMKQTHSIGEIENIIKEFVL